jgi:hypothetical protein
VASNFDLDATWVFFIPQFLVNWSMWYPLRCVSNYWVFFIVNNNAKINSINLEVMRCILCHNFTCDNVASNYIKKNVSSFHIENNKWLHATFIPLSLCKQWFLPIVKHNVLAYEKQNVILQNKSHRFKKIKS